MPVRAVPAVVSSRASSNVPSEEPKKKAQSIIDSLPGNSLASKAAILSASAGLGAAAISNELYVVNEESIVAFSLLTVFFAAFKYGGPAYSEWAEGQHSKILGILNGARKEHTEAVQKRISSVQDLSGVVEVTKNLFEVSKVRGLRHGNGQCRGTQGPDNARRKPPRSRLRPTSSSRRLPLPPRLRTSSTRGSATRARSSRGSSRSSPPALLPRLRRSLRTLRPSSRSSTRALPTSRVSCDDGLGSPCPC